MIPVFPKHRPQNLAMFTGLAIALFYVAVYRPLSYRADALDLPLAAAFSKLSTNSLSGFAVDASTPTNVQHSLARARLALTNLARAEKAILERIRPGPALRARLEEPFQLIDYLNDRQQRLEKLDQLAKERRVSVPAEVWASVPEYAADEKNASTLWIQLFVTEQLLGTAIRAGVSNISFLQILPGRTHEPTG